MTEHRQTTPPRKPPAKAPSASPKVEARRPRASSPPQDGQPPPPHAPPPPRWDEVDWDTWTPGAAGGPPRPRSGPDLAPLFALIDVMRSALPRELRDQFNTLIREILLTLRSLIDWYLERLGDGRNEARVEDIPIE